MADAFAHITVTYKARTGLPEDAVVNTLNFQSAVLAAGDLITQAMANLLVFFTHSYVNHPLWAYLSNVLEDDADSVIFKGYDVTAHLNGSVTGPPLRTETHQRTDSFAATGLPSQVAAVLSIHGAGAFAEGPPLGPRTASRHRGRVYLGPLNTTAVEQDVPGELEPHLSAVLIQDMAAAAAAADINTGNAVWSVWSRKNAAMYPVVGGFVDNGVDTQRRRAEDATARTNFTR